MSGGLRLLRMRNSPLGVVEDIFDGYVLAEAWDEMFAAPGEPRAPYDALVSVLQPMDPGELRYRADQLARVFTDRGVTYDYAGEERAMPTDLIPRVIDAAEWDLVSKGVRQRVRVLEAFLADVYGPGHAFDDGVVPWSLVFTSTAAASEDVRPRRPRLAGAAASLRRPRELHQNPRLGCRAVPRRRVPAP